MSLNTRSRLRLLCLVTATFAVGCADEERAETASVRDSAGIRIVENVAPLEDTPWSVAREPSVVIGGTEEDTTQLLFRVNGALVTSGGEIVVAHQPAPMVRWFSPEGEYLHGTGRPGGGPGEFGGGEAAWIADVWLLPNDSIATWEHPPRRMQVFTPDGDFVRSVVLELPPDMRVGAYPQIRGRLGEGFAGYLASPFSAGPEGEIRRDSLPYVRFASDGAFAGKLADLPGFKTVTRMAQAPDGRTFATPSRTILSPSPTSYARGNRFLYGPGDRYEILVFDTTGVLTMVVRKTVAATRVTPELVSEYVESMMASAPDNPAMRRQWREMLDAAPVESNLPVHRRVLSDATGAIWVQNYPLPGADSAEWSVFDPAGRWLSTVWIPTDWEILDLGIDYVLALWRNDLDVEHVRLHRLRRGL